MVAIGSKKGILVKGVHVHRKESGELCEGLRKREDEISSNYIIYADINAWK